MEFDTGRSSLKLITYNGYCWKNAQEREISFEDLSRAVAKLEPGCYVNRQPAYIVFLRSKKCSVQLTGCKVESDANKIAQEVNNIINRVKGVNKNNQVVMAPGAYPGMPSPQKR